MSTLSPTPRSTLTRKRDRAATDRERLYEVLDEALICHLGLVLNGSPVVLPTGYGRDGDTLYFHGSSGAGNIRAAAEGIDVCVTVTLLDGLVYARSLNNHSMNYRSAVVHGKARLVTGDEKMHGLYVVTEHLTPGSWDHARAVTAKERAAVSVLALDLAEASVKIRAGEPVDEPEDMDSHHIWAGVVPVQTTLGTPVPATYVPAGAPVPEHVRDRKLS
ncbi:pyridoxamine 5'-phosphate oxidase family protein [Amycolatopsis thermophila]|uniref:Nitroimidazol reductase NimA-like FMN-containing flavoprotein (Pyridoxamine 5'-phosphate oxidase superfamily) n=1 Tax=Amycolatopsis thermophila TaxID=206084 RepID=A0ABU0END1_9PSEU|nr:pyridoxamine 5'-phosphate oxidase family protein [Amycolatopsis thermophila]MDQ0376801.1 nitroimidazol reductase NimA-like FMN-containing flavoprotein (pyridoxamine 5'-phosphate oxidase superfamily) [Amycolatopsis thermophila]